jgi:hypothetical protein
MTGATGVMTAEVTSPVWTAGNGLVHLYRDCPRLRRAIYYRTEWWPSARICRICRARVAR